MTVPLLNDLSAAVDAASKSITNYTADICNIVKTSNKFNTNDFTAATQSLTDFSYLYESVTTFYNSFQNCLNNLTAENAQTSARSIDNLIYQIDTYILTGFEKLKFSATGLENVYGPAMGGSTIKISELSIERFTRVKNDLKTFSDKFMGIFNSRGSIATSDIDLVVLADLIAALKDLSTIGAQVGRIISGVTAITNALNTAITAVQATQANATMAMTARTQLLDTATEAAKSQFADMILKAESNLTKTFEEWKNLTIKLFVGDLLVLEQRGKVDLFVVTVLGPLRTLSDSYITSFLVSFVATAVEIDKLKSTIKASIDAVTGFFAGSADVGNGAIATCLGNGTAFIKRSTEIIGNLGAQGTTCIAQQESTAARALTLMTQAVDDILADAGGAADALCGCSVAGSVTNRNSSVDCMSKVRFIKSRKK